MTEEWLWLWFSYFKMNKHYMKYCMAKRDNSIATINRLEKRFPNINELYDDWGDIHSFDPREANKKHYKKWLSSRKHLFFNTKLPSAEVLKKAPDRFDRNYIYLKVPIVKNVADATKQATVQIRKAYNTPKLKKQRSTGTAKYLLATKLTNDRTLHGARKALNVWEMFYNVSGKTPTVMQVVKQIEQRVSNPRHNTWSNYWGWNKAVRKIAGNDDAVARQVKRYKAEATVMIENTLQGKFPAKKAMS